MNTVLKTTDLLVDVQSSADPRAIPIQLVGIRSVKHPLLVDLSTKTQPHSPQATVAYFNLYVGLPPSQKGTHMSRFIALLEEKKQAWKISDLPHILRDMLDKLEASTGSIEISFPIFLKKTAPVSGVESLLDYEIKWTISKEKTGSTKTTVQVQVPVTSLCPCSKQISDYGAHNQRSHITVTMEIAPNADFDLTQVIKMIEAQASCELYGLLKRPDEKYVTERAYDNPKFVEDLVRDIALQLKNNTEIQHFILEAENFESIHNHSAYALIDSRELC